MRYIQLYSRFASNIHVVFF